MRINSLEAKGLSRLLSMRSLMRKYSWFSRDVTAAMLVYRTMAKKVFWEFDSIIMQNLSDVLPLFCTPIWPSHHVSENQELRASRGKNLAFLHLKWERTYLSNPVAL